MNKEAIRMSQRAQGTPENLLCPLRRQMETGKVLFVRTAMEGKLFDAQTKNPNADFTEAQQKINLLIETEEYLRQLWELACQSNAAAFRAEQRITILQIKYDKMKQENENLKQSVAL